MCLRSTRERAVIPALTSAALLILLAGCAPGTNHALSHIRRVAPRVVDIRMNAESSAGVSNSSSVPESLAGDKDFGADELFRRPEAILARGGGVPREVDTGRDALSRFRGGKRSLLMYFLTTSAEWYLTRRDGKLVAYRRYTNNDGMWFTSPFGYMSPASDGTDFYSDWFATDKSPKIEKIRIALCIDGGQLAVPYGGDVTSVRAGTRRAEVRALDVGDQWDGRYLSTTVVLSGGPTLEVCEATHSEARPFTSAAIAYVNRELCMLSEGGRPLIPACSIKRGGKPELYMVRHGNNLLLCGYVNPGEPGYVYAAVFDKGTGKRLAYRWTRDNTIEYTGWSTNRRELYYFCVSLNELEEQCGSMSIELRFVPESGSAERCLIAGEFIQG